MLTMLSQAKTMWRLASSEGRLEVVRELQKISGIKPGTGVMGVSEHELANIDNFDDLPAKLCGALLLVADLDGWDYRPYQLYVDEEHQSYLEGGGT